jgi:hypothetical protein
MANEKEGERMIYQRTEIDARHFMDIFPEGSKFYRIPELPKIKFKANKVQYSITDVRLLNENAVCTFLNILNTVANEPDTEEVTFKIEDDTNEDTVEIITDILMGISYTAKKGGKHGFESSSSFLVAGVKRHETEDYKTITFKLIKDHAQAIYEYAQEHEQPNLYELVIAVEDKSREYMVEYLKEQEEILNGK